MRGHFFLHNPHNYIPWIYSTFMLTFNIIYIYCYINHMYTLEFIENIISLYILYSI